MGQTYSKWSDAELAILQEKAGKFSAAHIGQEIGRGTEGVNKMIRKLGLQSFVQYPTGTRPPAPPRPPREAKVKIPRPIKPVSPLKPKTVREAGIRHVSYPPLEYCHVHHVLVSNWSDHISRQGGTCERPAA